MDSATEALFTAARGDEDALSMPPYTMNMEDLHKLAAEERAKDRTRGPSGELEVAATELNDQFQELKECEALSRGTSPSLRSDGRCWKLNLPSFCQLLLEGIRRAHI